MKYWIGVGAQPSEVVARLLSRFHLIPTAPSRINIPTSPLLHMVLAGQDVRHLVPKPGQNPALALTEPVQHELTAQKFAQKQLSKAEQTQTASNNQYLRSDTPQDQTTQDETRLNRIKRTLYQTIYTVSSIFVKHGKPLCRYNLLNITSYSTEMKPQVHLWP